jgi:catechol 2,3-dioxygenase-like lactoylglutathione lyase family enzyme
MSERQGSVTGFWHAGVTVSNMDSALTFYRDGLGLGIASDRTIPSNELSDAFYGRPIGALRIVFLEVPGSDATIELFEFPDVDADSASAPPWHHGGGHLCLYVEDAEALLKRIKALGFSALGDQLITIPEGPEAGAKVAYLIDGDGYHVEIYEPA